MSTLPGVDAHRLDQDTRCAVVESYVLLVLHGLIESRTAGDQLTALGFGGIDEHNEDELITPDVTAYLERAVDAMQRRDRAVWPQRKRVAAAELNDLLVRISRPNAAALRRLTRQHADEAVTRLLEVVLPGVGGVHEEAR
jgi:hypothetical protein